MGWLYALSNGLMIPAAWTVAGCFIYLALKYRVKRLSSAFTAFGLLFFVGGAERLEHLAIIDVEWWKALTTMVVCLMVIVCAVAMIKCVGVAMPLLTKLAVKVRNFSEERAPVLQERDDPAEQSAFRVLVEVRDEMRAVLKNVGI